MAKQETNVDVSVKVNVQVDAYVDAHSVPEHDSADAPSVQYVEYVAPVALLAVVGALAYAIVSAGALVALAGLGGVVAVGAAGFFVYDQLPDLLNDWHCRRIQKAEMRLRMLEAQRPVIIMVASQEEAKRLGATVNSVKQIEVSK